VTARHERVVVGRAEGAEQPPSLSFSAAVREREAQVAAARRAGAASA
jgi:hypothetical protein